MPLRKRRSKIATVTTSRRHAESSPGRPRGARIRGRTVAIPALRVDNGRTEDQPGGVSGLCHRNCSTAVRVDENKSGRTSATAASRSATSSAARRTRVRTSYRRTASHYRWSSRRLGWLRCADRRAARRNPADGTGPPPSRGYERGSGVRVKRALRAEHRTGRGGRWRATCRRGLPPSIDPTDVTA